MVWYHDGMITDSTTVQKELLNEIENLNIWDSQGWDDQSGSIVPLSHHSTTSNLPFAIPQPFVL